MLTGSPRNCLQGSPTRIGNTVIQISPGNVLKNELVLAPGVLCVCEAAIELQNFQGWSGVSDEDENVVGT